MKKIKLFDPFFGKREEKALIKTLNSKFWASGSGVGQVSKFETMFKNYVNSKSAISVNSGTAALHLALSLFDIRNKEVIVPSLSFVSTVHAIRYNGGIPIFADIEQDSLCLDPIDVQNKISKKTKAILLVHFGGYPCNLNKFLKISKENKIHLIEDAAHAAGTKFNGKQIGYYGDATCFSFHPVKNLAMPSGGLITLNGKNTNKNEKILKSKRWCGISDRSGTKYDVKYLGFNYYMNEFSAAIGIEQLKKLDKMNNLRKKIARYYNKNIHTKNKIPLNSNCSYHLYWILIKNRDYLITKMKDNNIELGIHYKPIHKMKYYNSKVKLPITEDIANKIVSIPMHPNLSASDIQRVSSLLNKYADF